MAIALYGASLLVIVLSMRLMKACLADPKAHQMCRSSDKVYNSCVISWPAAAKVVHRGRGSDYFISAETPLVDCFITLWGVTHFVLYVILGALCPSLFYETFVLGVLFEVFEKIFWEGHDLLDILLNTLGFIVGLCVNQQF